MTYPELKGILAAVVTPFDADGKVDFAGIERQAEFIIGNGVHGVVSAGSTGEFATLSVDEQKAVNKAYIEAAHAHGGLAVAGTGALSTAEAIELTAAAKEDGADAVMIVPPFYDALSFDELLAHYKAISEAVDIQIMYYNMPGVTGVDLTPDQFARLGRETNVTCFKDTGGDNTKMATILFEHDDDIKAFNGWDTYTFQGLALGAEAGVWGGASFMPALAAELYQAVAVEKDLVRGRELWERINPICVWLEEPNYAAAIKAGVSLAGVDAGSTRPPIQPVGQEQRDELAALLREAGVEVKGQ
ncbi:dihydrodipicolinate synthase family protein [Leucobacter sp. wl10]|uniref:dihydrodipicolinate synthase family protein n=1 Tax=Leucobacter sp. wl10 TaxID=2304677 RepID=UPI000E5C304A|nr:dihydrodipicolinate synthase family protein [Leucobacter sp. wl10]RGE22019.1 dihydrodipicolinate synthase family protein [Leucobacter sp. wl10]